jgi:2-polyprenyl-3-methyl-5-hydroxy-6-metoxy-1,4-benzoquinol methylase
MSIECISCGNSSHYQLHIVKEMMYGLREEFTYFECSDCGCLQLVDIPTSLDKYYPDNYYSFQVTSKSNLTNKIKSFCGREQRRYSLFQQGILGRLVNIKYRYSEGELLRKLGVRKDWKILDIGCGAGLWLRSLSELGFANLYGVDPFIDADIDESSIKTIKIKKGTIHELEDSQKYNLIRSNHSFEHISDQYETLIKIHKLLDPNGFCTIAMPVKTETIWNRYGTNWVQIDAPRHIIIHTVASFTNLAQRAGFEVIDVTFNSTAFQFWGSEQYLRDIPLKSEKSYSVSPHNSIFSRRVIRDYHNEAERLNRESQGDQAIFVLKPIEVKQ